MPDHTCEYKAKVWCCNGFMFSLRLGGPVIKLDVIFVHPEVLDRPYQCALRTFEPLRNHWNMLNEIVPQSEKYMAGVVCGEGAVQDFSITKSVILDRAVSHLTAQDKAIFMAFRKTFESVKCPSLVLLAVYQGARFIAVRKYLPSSAYVAEMLVQLRNMGSYLYKDTPHEQGLFLTSRKFMRRTLDNANILHILTAEQLDFATRTLDTRILENPWYKSGNTWLYTALVASIMKMTPDMYDSHDPQRSMNLFREARGNSMPDVLVWDLLAIQAVSYFNPSLEHMLARKLVMNTVQEIPAMFNGRRQSPIEMSMYDFFILSRQTEQVITRLLDDIPPSTMTPGIPYFRALLSLISLASYSMFSVRAPGFFLFQTRDMLLAGGLVGNRVA